MMKTMSNAASWFLLMIAVSGCSRQGHDLHLIAREFPDRVRIKIDFSKGQRPARVAGSQERKTYAIQLDANGDTSINCTWPMTNPHRTFLVLPNETLRAYDDFSMRLVDTIRPVETTRKRHGVESVTKEDGSVYVFEFKRR